MLVRASCVLFLWLVNSRGVSSIWQSKRRLTAVLRRRNPRSRKYTSSKLRLAWVVTDIRCRSRRRHSPAWKMFCWMRFPACPPCICTIPSSPTRTATIFSSTGIWRSRANLIRSCWWSSSISNEKIKKEGYWAGLGTNPNSGQPITTNEWNQTDYDITLVSVAGGASSSRKSLSLPSRSGPADRDSRLLRLSCGQNPGRSPVSANLFGFSFQASPNRRCFLHLQLTTKTSSLYL
jgi:hypothetical protein